MGRAIAMESIEKFMSEARASSWKSSCRELARLLAISFTGNSAGNPAGIATRNTPTNG